MTTPVDGSVLSYPPATIVNWPDSLYLVQDGVDKRVTFEVLLTSLSTTTTTAAPTTTTAAP